MSVCDSRLRQKHNKFERNVARDLSPCGSAFEPLDTIETIKRWSAQFHELWGLKVARETKTHFSQKCVSSAAPDGRKKSESGL